MALDVHQKLHYENLAGLLVKRDGYLHWKCPDCNAEGRGRKVRRRCPECDHNPTKESP